MKTAVRPILEAPLHVRTLMQDIVRSLECNGLSLYVGNDDKYHVKDGPTDERWYMPGVVYNGVTYILEDTE